MDRRHLGSQYGPAVLSHFLCKYRLFNGGWMNIAFYIISLSVPYGRNERTHPYTCCSQVAYLVDLKAGVKLIASCQYFVNLIGGDCIQAASEGI